jgi:hypothetical protein
MIMNQRVYGPKGLPALEAKYSNTTESIAGTNHAEGGAIRSPPPAEAANPEEGIPISELMDTEPLPSQVGQGTIIDHLVDAMQNNPEATPVLQAHALALLRANLAAAHAIHTLTGDPTAFGHYSNGMRVLNQALGGSDAGITEQMIAQGIGGDEGRAIAPVATDIANLAVPTPQTGGQQ